MYRQYLQLAVCIHVLVSVTVISEASGSVCEEPKKVDPCRAAIERYFFNKDSGQCEKFIWGGCQPNGNNFETMEECKAQCVYNCEAPKKIGPCKAAIQKFFFNKDSGVCEKFIWGGCQPNGNNFDSMADCRATCFYDCEAPMDAGSQDGVSCKAAMSRYFYNSATSKCEEFSYTGCGGNGNNFKSKTKCIKTCSKCERPKQTKDCEKKTKQYYYSSKKGKCIKYKGCGGFGTKDECVTSCMTPPDGEEKCERPMKVEGCDKLTKQWYYNSSENKCIKYKGCDNFDSKKKCTKMCVTKG